MATLSISQVACAIFISKSGLTALCSWLQRISSFFVILLFFVGVFAFICPSFFLRLQLICHFLLGLVLFISRSLFVHESLFPFVFRSFLVHYSPGSFSVLSNSVVSLCALHADRSHRISNIRVIHRDLKSENCLIRENGTVVVCDFGLARIMEGEVRPFPQHGVISVSMFLFFSHFAPSCPHGARPLRNHDHRRLYFPRGD